MLTLQCIFDRNGNENKPEMPYVICLQAADLAAWEMRREMARRTGLIMGKKLRKSFEALQSIQPRYWQHLVHEDIVRFCESEKVGRRAEG